MSQLKHRLTVAAWGIPLIIALCLIGGWLFALFLSAVCFLGQREFYRLASQREVLTPIGLLWGGLLPLVVHFFPGLEIHYLALGMLLIVLAAPFTKLENIQKRMGVLMGGIIYPSLFISFLVLIRDGNWSKDIHGGLVILFILSTVWICDTAAYFGGRKFGRKKLAPIVSPKKTVEGALFGFAGGIVWAIIISPLLSFLLTFGQAVFTAILVGIVGQLGDLAESALKRSAGVKDSGTLLPGHGGALDRFDSITALAPAIYIYYTIVGIL